MSIWRQGGDEGSVRKDSTELSFQRGIEVICVSSASLKAA